MQTKYIYIMLLYDSRSPTQVPAKSIFKGAIKFAFRQSLNFEETNFTSL